MNKGRKLTKSFLVLTILLLAGFSGFAQKKAAREAVQQNPVLWEPVNISQMNLHAGPGGEAMRPNLRRITFIKEEKGGHNKKYRIKDASGRVWIAKLGREARPETAAVRILHGLGYKTEVNYLVPTITIPGKGTHQDVRLEARPANIERLDEWKWRDNPFVGTNELQGLKIMMVFFTNWDLLDLQNKLLRVNNRGRIEHHYIVSDLGATFGKLGNNNLPIVFRIGRRTGDAGTWFEAGFINKVEGDMIDFDFKGKGRGLMEDITVQQGRWLADLLVQLSDKQITDAFSAANFSPEEVKLLREGFKARVEELNVATRRATAAN